MAMPSMEKPPTGLTVGEAAELLNESRAHLLTQVSSETIPSRGAGSARLLAIADVLARRKLIDFHASQALDAMSSEAEDAGLYE